MAEANDVARTNDSKQLKLMEAQAVNVSKRCGIEASDVGWERQIIEQLWTQGKRRLRTAGDQGKDSRSHRQQEEHAQPPRLSDELFLLGWHDRPQQHTKHTLYERPRRCSGSWWACLSGTCKDLSVS